MFGYFSHLQYAGQTQEIQFQDSTYRALREQVAEPHCRREAEHEHYKPESTKQHSLVLLCKARGKQIGKHTSSGET